MGVSANAEGNYELNVTAGSYQVLCQYIGFGQEVYTLDINSTETIMHDFKLREQNTQMKEVVVKANSEDPAYTIIRNTIARRSYHLDEVHTFQTSIYLKGVGRTREAPSKVFGQKIDKGELGLDTAGKGILFLCEENADYYAAMPHKSRTVIHSVVQSGDPKGLGFAQLPSVISFYENNVPIFSPRGFVSPIAENALYYYRYKYLGEYRENGYTINKIQVIPRRKYEATFSGTIYITDGDWAIHSLDMLVTDKASLSLLDTARIRQLYLPLDNNQWVIKNQVVYATFKIFGFDVTANLVTVYNNQKVNAAIPDTMFNDKVMSEYDKKANQKDSAFWNNARPIPLEGDEKKDYILKDSIRKKEEDPRYIDSLRRVGNKVTARQILVFGLDKHTKKNKDNIRTNALLTMVNYNTVEGLNVSPRAVWTHTIDTSRKLETRMAVRYGFSNTHFNAIARTGYTYSSPTWIGRRWTIGAEAGKYVFQYNPTNPVPELYNTISTLFYNQNYLKIYERWNAKLYMDKQYANGWEWHVKTGYEHRLPLRNTTDYSWAGHSNKLTDNLPDISGGYNTLEEHSAVLVEASISYRPGYKYVLYPDYKMPGVNNRMPLFTLSYEKGVPGILNSKVDFDKWRFSIVQQLRMKLLGVFSYNIAAGGFLNKNYVALPDMMHLNGNQFIALPTGFYLSGFELAPYYLYSNTAPLYGEAHVEYNLEGLITNKIPLLRRARWYAVIGNNTFYTATGSYYTEAFIGIDNIGVSKLRGFRVDLVQGWDSDGRMRNGIRVGLKPSLLIHMNTRKEEW